MEYPSMTSPFLSNICPVFDPFFYATGHGPQTGRCVPNDKSDRYGNITVCEIQSWYDDLLMIIYDDDDY